MIIQIINIYYINIILYNIIFSRDKLFFIAFVILLSITKIFKKKNKKNKINKKKFKAGIAKVLIIVLSTLPLSIVCT